MCSSDLGNLTLNNPMKEALKTVEVWSGDLVVAEGVEIGNPLTPTGELKLGSAADKVGHLKLNGDMTLAKLTTAVADNTINTNGKTLVLKPGAAFDINALVTGNVSVELTGNFTVTLNKDVKGTVRLQAAAGAGSTLELAEGVKVDVADFTAKAVGDVFKLNLRGKNQIGTLSFVKTKRTKPSYAPPWPPYFRPRRG